MVGPSIPMLVLVLIDIRCDDIDVLDSYLDFVFVSIDCCIQTNTRFTKELDEKLCTNSVLGFKWKKT